MSVKTRNDLEHILHYGLSEYNRQINKSTCDAVISLIEKYAQKADKVWDFGVGRGEIFDHLKKQDYDVKGIDFKVHAKYRGSKDVANMSIEEWLDTGQSADVIIMSHVMEHLASPYEIMTKLSAKVTKFIVIAVPNPLFLPMVFKSLFCIRRTYVNDGHLWSWDFHHLRNFFKVSTGGVIFDQKSDVVTLPLPGKVRKFLNKIFIYRWLEFRCLPKILPMFSRSIIIIVRMDQESESLSGELEHSKLSS